MYGAILLAVAIVIEVGATSLLPRAQGFTDPLWTTIVIGGYALSVWLLAVVVKTMPVSVAYAVWSGVGTALVAAVGMAFLGESISTAKVLFLTMIVTGVVGLNVVSPHA